MVDLGGGWEEHFDNKYKQAFYHHRATGRSQWEKPEGLELLPASGEPAGGLSCAAPPGSAGAGPPQAVQQVQQPQPEPPASSLRRRSPSPPRRSSGAAAAGDAGDWQTFHDTQYNRPYYYNKVTRRSQWDRPAGVAPPPSARLALAAISHAASQAAALGPKAAPGTARKVGSAPRWSEAPLPQEPPKPSEAPVVRILQRPGAGEEADARSSPRRSASLAVAMPVTSGTQETGRGGGTSKDPWANMTSEGPTRALRRGIAPGIARSLSMAPPSDPWQKADPWGGSTSLLNSHSRRAHSRAPVGWQPHVPCMLYEAVTHLLPQHRLRKDSQLYDGTYVDCTFGRGGHSKEILKRLSPEGKLFAFDVDPEAISCAKSLEQEDPRFRIIERPFGDIGKMFSPGQLDGVVMDLGVSSPQLDARHRGFTDREEGPLDMRMNQDQGMPAADWLRTVTTEELAWVIHAYGEDEDPVLADRIAECIMVDQKNNARINTTRQLAQSVRTVKPTDDTGMPPTKLTFQAIRVFLNQEMQQLDKALEGALRNLSARGRCCVIAFKRKESNAIRKFTREHEEPDNEMRRKVSNVQRLRELYPLLTTHLDYSVQQVAHVRASLEEISENNRARSSQVHVLEKRERRSVRVVGSVSEKAPRSFAERFKEPMAPLFVGPASSKDTCLHALLERTPSKPAKKDASSPKLKVAKAPFLSSTHDGSSVMEPAAGKSYSATEKPTLPDTFLRKPGQHPPLPVLKDFSEFEGVEGYLPLKSDDMVVLLYEGETEEERGWLYGFVHGRVDAKGWFPKHCVVTVAEAG